MALALGTRRLGPGQASLLVRTYRDGVAAKAGHDLVLEVTRWEAALDVAAPPAGTTIELTADPGSLVVRDALGGVKPLSDRDRAEIARNIDKVLGGRPIRFRSSRVRAADGGLDVEGELAIGDVARPMGARLDVDAAGRMGGAVALRQTDFGITPYRGLMGALKVRDEVEVALDVPGPD